MERMDQQRQESEHLFSRCTRSNSHRIYQQEELLCCIMQVERRIRCLLHEQQSLTMESEKLESNHTQYRPEQRSRHVPRQSCTRRYQGRLKRHRFHVKSSKSGGYHQSAEERHETDLAQLISEMDSLSSSNTLIQGYLNERKKVLEAASSLLLLASGDQSTASRVTAWSHDKSCANQHTNMNNKILQDLTVLSTDTKVVQFGCNTREEPLPPNWLLSL